VAAAVEGSLLLLLLIVGAQILARREGQEGMVGSLSIHPRVVYLHRNEY
jgi:hypothetical protein